MCVCVSVCVEFVARWDFVFNVKKIRHFLAMYFRSFLSLWTTELDTLCCKNDLTQGMRISVVQVINVFLSYVVRFVGQTPQNSVITHPKIMTRAVTISHFHDMFIVAIPVSCNNYAVNHY